MAILYAAQGTSATTSDLYTLDPLTGAVSSDIGPIGYAITGLAFDPTSGILYGSTSNNSAANPASIITINTTTGAGTLVGAIGLGVFHAASDICFTSDGQMWGLDSSDGLIKINKGTGVGTTIGGGSLFSSAFDSDATDRFLLVRNSNIYVLRQDATKTFLSTPVGWPGFTGTNSGSFGPDSLFYATNPGSPNPFLVTVDWISGTITSIGTTLSLIDALTWDTQVKPTLPGAPPANDNFENAQNMPGPTGSAAGTTDGATNQVGEPLDQLTGTGPFNTVWYKRFATNNKTVMLTLTVATGSLDMEVWSGTTLTGLTLVVKGAYSGTGKLVYGQITGETFYVRVQGQSGAISAFTLAWAECSLTAPINDDFANAITITGSGTIVQSQQCATVEPGEPIQHPPGGVDDHVDLFTTWAMFTLARTGRLTLTWNSGPAGTAVSFPRVDLYFGPSRTLYGTINLIAPTHTFTLGSGNYYIQFVNGADTSRSDYWGPDFNITYAISEVAITGTHPDITTTSVGSYTRIDAWPGGLLGKGGWIRFMLTRNSGDFIHQGQNLTAADGVLRIAETATIDGLTSSNQVVLQGGINGSNIIGGATLIDGVSGDVGYMGVMPRSQDTVLVEIHIAVGVTDVRYIDLGMLVGPAVLTGWSLTYSHIAWSDDPAWGPFGSIDPTSKDIGYFAGWTDTDCHLAAVGTLPTPTASPPGGGPSFALEVTHHSGAGSGITIPLAGVQPESGVSFQFYATAWPNGQSIVNIGLTKLSLQDGGSGTIAGGLYMVNQVTFASDLITVLSLNTWNDIEYAVDALTGDQILTVNGSQFVQPGVGIQSYVTSIQVGLLGALTTGHVYVGAVAVGRSRKSYPLGQALVEALPVTAVGTHLLPDMNPAGQIRGFTNEGEIIYGGTEISCGTWCGDFSCREGSSIAAGTLNAGNATVTGSPTTSATMFAPDGFGFSVRMMDAFNWPLGDVVFFDYYVTGPAGKTVTVGDIGELGQVLGTNASIVCDGSRQHASGWSNVAGLDPWLTSTTFNLRFPSGGDTYTVDSFRAFITPLILPVYATSTTGGNSPSLIDTADTVSASYLADGSDATVVILDRQGTFITVAEMGDFSIGKLFPFTRTYRQEGTSFAARYDLDYQIAGPTVAPDAAKIVARTGGYTGGLNTLVASTVSAQSRFGFAVDGVEKAVGSLSASTIAGGELVVPEPPDPSSRWTGGKLANVRLRMGYCDQVGADTNFLSFGMHAIGGGADRTLNSGGGGGIVAAAHLEALRLVGNYGPVSFSFIKTGQRRAAVQVR